MDRSLVAGIRIQIKKKYRKPALTYVRARAAFVRADYAELAEQCLKFGKHPFEVFGQIIRQFSLIAYYELMYCHDSKTRPKARKLEPDPRKTLGSMRDNVDDLNTRQDRGAYQLDYYSTFIDCYSELLYLKEQSEKLPEGSDRRFRLLFKPRRDLLEKLTDFDFLAGKWLRKQLKNLQ